MNPGLIIYGSNVGVYAAQELALGCVSDCIVGGIGDYVGAIKGAMSCVDED